MAYPSPPLIARCTALLALALLAACGGVVPRARPSLLPPPSATVVPIMPPLPPANALTVGVRAGPDMASLGLNETIAGPALLAFRESCPRLLARNDASGLTQREDWRAACAAAPDWAVADAGAFFAEQFDPAIVGDGASYVTGYYEPEIAGVRLPQPGFAVPIYGVPPDLVHARPGDAPVKPNGQTPFGRYDPATGLFTPFFTRAEIDAGVLANKGLEIGWAADPVEVFFLQVQGSGRLRAPDGTVMRIGYAADNGRDYTGIGVVMRDQGLIGTAPGQYAGSMQGIMQYLREHPADGAALMERNQSWVFFREIIGDGPIGALGVPVRARVSLAADPLFVPLGAPVFLAMDRAIASGLWVADDTGGAIKGANRFDSFWGAGADARVTAGGMAARGNALVLLPKGVIARLIPPAIPATGQ